MIFDAHHPPSRPEKTFPQTRDYPATRATSPNKTSEEGTRRGAQWFSPKRSGGSSILLHRRIRAVFTREWASEMDGIAATIAATTSLFDYNRGALRDIPAAENARSS